MNFREMTSFPNISEWNESFYFNFYLEDSFKHQLTTYRNHKSDVNNKQGVIGRYEAYAVKQGHNIAMPC